MTPSTLRQIWVSAVSSGLAAGSTSFLTAQSTSISLLATGLGGLGGALWGWITRRRFSHPISTPLPPLITHQGGADIALEAHAESESSSHPEGASPIDSPPTEANSEGVGPETTQISSGELKRSSSNEFMRSPSGEFKRALPGEFPRVIASDFTLPSSSEFPSHVTGDYKRIPTSELRSVEMLRSPSGEFRKPTLSETKRAPTSELRKPDLKRHPTGEVRSQAAEGGAPSTPPNIILAFHSLLPTLMQGSLTLEELLKIDKTLTPEEHARIFHALKPLLHHTHATLMRARHSLETALKVSFDRDFYPHILEPTFLRDELIAPLQTICLTHKCELAYRSQSCSTGAFLANRRSLRVATLAILFFMLTRGTPSHELLCELSSEELSDGRVRINIVFDTAPQALDQPAPPLLSFQSRLTGNKYWINSLPHMFLPEQEFSLGANEELSRVSMHFTLERAPLAPLATEYPNTSFVGRQALVVDSRSISRRTLCELLHGWQLATTSVSTLQEALTLLAQGGRHDMLIINLSEEEWPQLTLLESQALRLANMPILTLEDLHSRLKPLPEALLGHSLTLDRLIRPVSPLELLERLQARLNLRSPEVSLAAQGDGLRVLVVEDNPVNQTLMSALLERMGYLPTIAGHGAEALDILLAYPGVFDLILMDIQMPFMDGYETTNMLRLRETNLGLPRIPVIAVTAHALEGEQRRCIEAGMDSYLAKPIDELTLRREIRKWVDPSKAGNTEPTSPSVSIIYEHFNADHVRALAGDDLAFIHQLITVMRDTAGRLLLELHQALQQGSLENVSRIAHQLKGGVSNFRADQAYQAANALEQRARLGSGPDVAPLVTDLERSITHLLAELKAFAADEVEAHRLGLRAKHLNPPLTN